MSYNISGRKVPLGRGIKASWENTTGKYPTDKGATSYATATPPVRQHAAKNQTEKYLKNTYQLIKDDDDLTTLKLGDRFKYGGRYFQICENSQSKLHAKEDKSYVDRFLHFFKKSTPDPTVKYINSCLPYPNQMVYQVEIDDTLLCRAVQNRQGKWELPADKDPKRYGTWNKVRCQNDVDMKNYKDGVPVFFDIELIRRMKLAKKAGAKVYLHTSSNWRPNDIINYLKYLGLEVNGFVDQNWLKNCNDTNFRQPAPPQVTLPPPRAFIPRSEPIAIPQSREFQHPRQKQG